MMFKVPLTANNGSGFELAGFRVSKILVEAFTYWVAVKELTLGYHIMGI